MKKEFRQLFLPLTILAVLVIALVVYLVVDKVNKRGLENDLAPVYITIAEEDKISEISIEKPSGDAMAFHFDANGNLTEAEHNGDKYDSSRMKVEYAKNLKTAFSRISVVKELESPSSDRSIYGLAPEEYKVTIKRQDGSQSTILFGKMLEDNSGIYAASDVKDGVIVAKSTYLSEVSSSFENYMNLYAENIAASDLDNIVFLRHETGDKFVIEMTEEALSESIYQTSYKLKEPLERDMTPAMRTLIDSILQLEVTSFMDIPADKRMDYGLDKPSFEFRFSLRSGEERMLYLSREISGFYYGYVSDDSYCFKIYAGSLTGLNLPIDELMDFYVVHEYLDNVRYATVKVGEDIFFRVEYRFDSSMTLASEDAVLRLDQRDARVVSKKSRVCYGLMLFESIFRMKIDHLDMEAQPALTDPEATITVQTQSGTSYTIKLQKLDSEYYYCFINDSYSGFIVDRSVLYRDNGQYLSGFGIVDAYKLTNEAIDNKDVDGYYDRVDKENTDA